MSEDGKGWIHCAREFPGPGGCRVGVGAFSLCFETHVNSVIKFSSLFGDEHEIEIKLSSFTWGAQHLSEVSWVRPPVLRR